MKLKKSIFGILKPLSFKTKMAKLFSFKTEKCFAQTKISLKNPQPRHPRESGDPSSWLIKMDSRFRGNNGI